jgi:hypothetical protein
MIREWSDGTHDDSDRPAALRRELAQASDLGSEIVDLRMQNEWLRLQLDCPWRIENYRARPIATRTDRYSTAAA